MQFQLPFAMLPTAAARAALENVRGVEQMSAATRTALAAEILQLLQQADRYENGIMYCVLGAAGYVRLSAAQPLPAGMCCCDFLIVCRGSGWQR